MWLNGLREENASILHEVLFAMHADFRLRPRYWLPSLVTAASLSAGFVSMMLAADGRFDAAVYLLVLAIVLDMMDGRIARWLRATSEFGRQLDSISDAVSSGAAPALLIYLALLRDLGILGVVVVLVYLLAGMFRLARFNLVTDPHSKARWSIGVPIPIGAGYLMAVVLMRDKIDPVLGAAVVLLAAVAMVSRRRFPNLKGANVVTAMLVVGIFNYLAVVAWPNWYTVGWWNVWNVFILLAAWNEDRRMTLETSTDP